MQGKLLTWKHRDHGFPIFRTGGDPEGKTVVNFDVSPRQIGSKVAGICHKYGVVRVNAQNDTGGETALAAREKAIIHGAENLGWVLGVLRQRLKGADEKRNRHGRRHTFSTDVAYRDQRPAARHRDDLKEVSAH